MVRRNWLFFLLATIVALALRFLFVFRFPHIAGDTLVYGDIAKNWLDHGIFGLTDNGQVRPTLIRLPGYPAFLAAMFTIFGREHYTAVMIVQALIDTNTCLVIAALAMELMNERTGKAAYLLAALCPFTANYVASPLSETLSIFCLAHAFYYGVRGLKSLGLQISGQQISKQQTSEPHLWIVAGLWSAAAVYMRPDNGLILAALGIALLVVLFRNADKKKVVLSGLLLAIASLAPLAPWAYRNWHVFHVWQPLTSRYATDPGEFIPHGFNHWVKTWMVDYVSVEDVFWHVSGEPFNPQDLPSRAFDSSAQYQQTLDLISRYNDDLAIDAQMDNEFDQIAVARIRHSYFRYYIWLPLLRTADMWLRPRTEMLNVETRWWEFDQHNAESLFAIGWAALNLLFIVLGARGWIKWPLGIAGVYLLSFIVLRSLFLSTLENPEPRYMLECFPALLALAGGTFSRRIRPSRT